LDFLLALRTGNVSKTFIVLHAFAGISLDNWVRGKTSTSPPIAEMDSSTGNKTGVKVVQCVIYHAPLANDWKTKIPFWKQEGRPCNGSVRNSLAFALLRISFLFGVFGFFSGAFLVVASENRSALFQHIFVV